MAAYRFIGPLCSLYSEKIDDGTMCRARSPLPGPVEMFLFDNNQFLDFVTLDNDSQFPTIITTFGKKAASSLSLSDKAIELLKEVEKLRLKPYDDQTSNETLIWVEGATIGYGHLIKKFEWEKYKKGISISDAKDLFDEDTFPYIVAVRFNIKIRLNQNQFDALVFLAFNIGVDRFSKSTVVLLINKNRSDLNYKNIEIAWKSLNKSQGKVMKGLVNRRECEWQIYSQNIYKRW